MTDIEVEVVFASSDKQLLRKVRVPTGARVSDVIAASGVRQDFPEQNWEALRCGIWGKEVGRAMEVAAGDRVEIYRPLKLDPREARRQLAASGRTMGNADSR
jgi:putative ubiquitin-RnfH superfamily antitoxin RatB of RatAB toxin-antitoxin module